MSVGDCDVDEGEAGKYGFVWGGAMCYDCGLGAMAGKGRGRGRKERWCLVV